MSLEMKQYCAGCGKRLFKRSEAVYICSYESTYCEECAVEKKLKCDCCEGKLEKRPARILSYIKAIPVNDIEEILFYDRNGNIINSLKFDKVFNC